MTQSSRVILSMVVAVLVLSQSPALVRADEGCAELYAVLRSATGDALVQAVQRGDLGCLRFLERVSDRPLQIAVSLESNVLTVANSIPEAMTDYDASQNTGVEQLFLYLRMARDIHLWCLTRRSCDGDEWINAEGYSIDVGSPVHTAVKAAIDSFVHHSLFRYAGSEHADNLYEVGRTIIDYGMSGLYLSMVEGWLNAWDDNYAAIPAFPRAMLTVMDVVRLGHVQPGFGAVVGENRGLVHAFRDFALAERWLGTSSQWIMQRSVNELGRYFKYKNTTNYNYVLPVAQSVLTTYRNRPETKALFLRMVAEIDYNDGGNCSRYGLCDWYAGEGFNANFRAALFTDTMVCPVNACSGDSMTIHAQDLELDLLATGCRRLYEEGQAFQSLFDTQCTPVPGDLNSHLDIYVFDDKADCRDMESGAFGISADTCSGIYYENDPSDPNTSAEMVAVEYEDAKYAPDPELPIRNFEHEYAHHLDGRFNTRGLYRWDDDSIHWWTEGFAEYLAAEVSPYIGLPRCESPYSLTETLLHSDSIPTRYHHRHLAVRFLMEHHRDFVDTLLEYMRRGEYMAYTAHMAAEAPKLEEDWQVWKSACQAAGDFRIYPYCRSGPRYDEFGYIARVVLGSLDHADDVNHGHRFNDDTVTVQAGSTVELCVTTSTEVPVMDDINRVEAWIDWGGDGGFDESTEQVMNSEVRLTNRDNPVTVCANVTVPTDAYIGRVRLRVRTQYKLLSGEGQGVCENYQSGETQDYDIVVTGDPNPGDGNGGNGDLQPPPWGDVFIPVILNSTGRSNSLFTSALTLTNRGDEDITLDYTYTAHRGGGSGVVSEVLEAGRQRIEPDALGYLRKLGMPVPGRGDRLGTLRVEVPITADVGVLVRTTTAVPEGRAGLAYVEFLWRKALRKPFICVGCVRTAGTAPTWQSRTWGRMERLP